jgi:hypothetical protein
MNLLSAYIEVVNLGRDAGATTIRIPLPTIAKASVRSMAVFAGMSFWTSTRIQNACLWSERLSAFRCHAARSAVGIDDPFLANTGVRTDKLLKNPRFSSTVALQK